MTTNAITIPCAASAPSLRGHLSAPRAGGGPWPGVVLLHEGPGLNDDIRRHADRFAAAGYLAVAVDLYTAGGALRCMLATFRALLRREGRAFADIEAARCWIAARPDCTGRVGVVGFCMGGGFALLAAARGFDVSAPNYPALTGRLPREALRGACPIVASYGGRDPLTKGAAARLEAALRAEHVAHDVREYPRARHSFLSRHDAGALGPLVRIAGFGYDAAAAEDAWGRMLSFFDRHLRQTAPSGEGARPEA